MSEIIPFVDEKMRRVIAQQVKKALRDGVLVKPDCCSWCGETSQPIHAHHPDYARPLMVVWICAPCHRQHHVIYRTEHALIKDGF